MDIKEENSIEYRSLLKSNAGQSNENEIDEALFLRADGSPLKSRFYTSGPSEEE